MKQKKNLSEPFSEKASPKNNVCEKHLDLELSVRGTKNVKIFYCQKCFPELKTLECYCETKKLE